MFLNSFSPFHIDTENEHTILKTHVSKTKLQNSKQTPIAFTQIEIVNHIFAKL